MVFSDDFFSAKIYSLGAGGVAESFSQVWHFVRQNHWKEKATSELGV